MKQFILEKATNKGLNIAKFPKILEQNKECSLLKLNNKKILYKDASKLPIKEYCGSKMSDLTGNYILLNIPKIKNNSNNTDKEIIKVTPINNWYNFVITEKIESNTLDIIEKNQIEYKKNLAEMIKIPTNTKNKKSKVDLEANLVKANLTNTNMKNDKIPDPLKSIFINDDNLELKEMKELEDNKFDIVEKKEKNKIKKKKTKRNDDSLSDRDSVIEEDLSFDGNNDLKDVMLNKEKKFVFVSKIKDDFLNNEDDTSNGKISNSEKSSEQSDSILSDDVEDYEDESDINENLLGKKRNYINLEDALNQIFSVHIKISRTKLLEELDKINISMKDLQSLDDILNKKYKSLKNSSDIIYIKKN